MKIKHIYSIICLTFLFQIGCTEPYEIETVAYENVLVVESTITDEFKTQVVKLSKTSTLEDTDVLIENDATVTVTGTNGEVFNFSQNNSNGYYVSNQPFQAQPAVEYTLKIVTNDGKEYVSSSVILPPPVEMDQVFAEPIVEASQNKDGVQVLVNTEDLTGNAKYFRYEYEETYKIVAPNPSSFTTEIINYNPLTGTYQVVLTQREPEEVCYSTENSTGITQASTTELNENRVYRFPVRYLSKFDSRIQTRYSILVKQYVQSVEAFTFYKIVKELGSVGSLLSQGQPGYVAGNMKATANPEEKVLGFFEASSMTSNRIYFNYEDFNFRKPPYFVDCDLQILDYNDSTTLDNDPNERETFHYLVTSKNYQVIRLAQGTLYTIARPECTLCTSFSSNTRPDFWED